MASDSESEQRFVDKALKRIAGHPGVYGLLVVNPHSGRILHKSGFENSSEICERWADSLLSFLSVAASTVRTLDHTDDITFLRMQWREKHITICPDPNREYTVVVVQEQVHQLPPDAVEAATSLSSPLSVTVGGGGVSGSGGAGGATLTGNQLVEQLLNSNTNGDLGATAAP